MSPLVVVVDVHGVLHGRGHGQKCGRDTFDANVIWVTMCDTRVKPVTSTHVFGRFIRPDGNICVGDWFSKTELKCEHISNIRIAMKLVNRK